jgi:PAS domain-containing protein
MPTSPSESAKRTEEEVANKEAQLRIAMDNMPGALVYTNEELNVVVHNDRFAEMYPVPKELLQPGRPYTDFLRYLAEHGYYGEGDVEVLVAERGRGWYSDGDHGHHRA